MFRTRKSRSIQTLQKIAAGVCVCGLVACAPTLPPSIGDAPGRQSAFFAEFPSGLFDAAASSCSRPADTLLAQEQYRVECESLVTPDIAAALVLQFDGDLEDLPVYINQLSAEPVGSGFKVTAEYFFRVPQITGETAEVRVRVARTERTVREVFMLAGGQAIEDPL